MGTSILYVLRKLRPGSRLEHVRPSECLFPASPRRRPEWNVACLCGLRRAPSREVFDWQESASAFDKRQLPARLAQRLETFTDRCQTEPDFAHDRPIIERRRAERPSHRSPSAPRGIAPERTWGRSFGHNGDAILFGNLAVLDRSSGRSSSLNRSMPRSQIGCKAQKVWDS